MTLGAAGAGAPVASSGRSPRLKWLQSVGIAPIESSVMALCPSENLLRQDPLDGVASAPVPKVGKSSPSPCIASGWILRALCHHQLSNLIPCRRISAPALRDPLCLSVASLPYQASSVFRSHEAVEAPMVQLAEQSTQSRGWIPQPEPSCAGRRANQPPATCPARLFG